LIDSLTLVAGALLDATGSFVWPFLVSGGMIAAGGLMGLPARRIARWDLQRNDKRNAEVHA